MEHLMSSVNRNWSCCTKAQIFSCSHVGALNYNTNKYNKYQVHQISIYKKVNASQYYSRDFAERNEIAIREPQILVRMVKYL